LDWIKLDTGCIVLATLSQSTTSKGEKRKMERTITQEIQELQHMKFAELQDKFKEVFGYPPVIYKPQTLRKRLAFRMQELYYGGLTASEHEILNDIADGRKTPGNNEPKGMMPGTILTRLWKGKVYETTIMKDGCYEYGGRIFRSLSAVAREITGSRWNGKVFFGVKQ
jgi:hypothetical protein